MSQHIEIVDEAASFNGRPEEFLLFVWARISQLERPDDYPCLWCTGAEDNELVVFDDLQNRTAVSNVNTVTGNDGERDQEAIEGLKIEDRWDNRVEYTPIAVVLDTSAITEYTPTPPIRQQPTKTIAAPLQRSSRPSRPVDKHAILARERQRREEQRARGQKPSNKRKLYERPG